LRISISETIDQLKLAKVLHKSVKIQPNISENDLSLLKYFKQIAYQITSLASINMKWGKYQSAIKFFKVIQ
jgi:hypothetical protein